MCVCARVCVRACACVRPCMCACMCRVHACVRVCARTCVRAFVRACVRACLHRARWDHGLIRLYITPRMYPCSGICLPTHAIIYDARLEITLDSHICVGAAIMDLCIAFDCLPHNRLVTN